MPLLSLCRYFLGLAESRKHLPSSPVSLDGLRTDSARELGGGVLNLFFQTRFYIDQRGLKFDMKLRIILSF